MLRKLFTLVAINWLWKKVRNRDDGDGKRRG